MFLCLYVGNALKDLISAPRPITVKKGTEKARLLSCDSSNLEAHSSSLVRP